MSDVRIDEAHLDASAVVTSTAGLNYSYEVHGCYRFDLRNSGDRNATVMLAHAMTGSVSVHSFSLDYWTSGYAEGHTAVLYQSTELLGRYDIWARHSSAYHILNVTLVNETSVVLNIHVRFRISASADILNLGFAASDSLPWDNNAFQIIELSVLNKTLFEGIGFIPNTSVSTLDGSGLTTLYWELNMTSFAEKYVTAILVQNEYMPPHYDLRPAAVATVVVLVFVVVDVAVLRRYFTNHRQATEQ
ncbi:hypothetical protein EU538_03990 [Candidatus Thorarchaeota archaeon]|nr:MAG: hypothetical protein EU538_03990 [Candidatus Thorarchaeota archaeon]